MASIQAKFDHFDPHAMQDDLMGSPQVVRTVLKHFLAWTTGTSDELHRALAAPDVDAVARAAHSLRGTLAQLHAHAGSRLAGALEAHCTQKQALPAALATELFDELDAVVRDVRAYLAATPPA